MTVQPASLAELHPCPVGGVDYVFRTPDVYDPARARRLLARQRVRRPALTEFRVAAQAGLTAMGEAAGQMEEGERQAALLGEWYDLADPTDENSIDEPDQDARTAIVATREAERIARQRAIYPEVAAIEANLERHWPPYAELLADRVYWDEVSVIETVRLLLVSKAGQTLPRDDDGLVTQEAYKAIPPYHRMTLATFSFRLLAPDETQRKN